ncbi:MAG: alanine--glyoxylate aminotransferase family protein [Candidatus Heimdallarchaeota archaeon]|nr:alanine--glyoxylate aminotransferase family protein [Candidatus Heimdallarchaeota archaeon]
MHKKLWIPGPTEVEDDVLKAQAKPLFGHRSNDFTLLYDSVLTQLRKFFKTEQHVLVHTASGTIFMDIAARNLVRPGKKALACINGSFSSRMYDTLVDSGIETDRLDVEWGKAIKPELIKEKLDESDYDIVTICYNETSTGVKADLEAVGSLLKNYPETLLVVDAVSSMGGDLLLPDVWGTDLVFASTQKCFALPPGLSVVIVSQAAYDRTRDVPNKGTYINLEKLLDYYGKKKQTPSTPNISLLFAFDYKLKQMLVEGAENIYKRHKAMADYTHEWALKHGFGLFAEDGYKSVTVTTVENKLEKDVGDLNKKLAEKGFVIANGYGKLKGLTFRIGHMGDHTLEGLKELLAAIEEIWEL